MCGRQAGAMALELDQAGRTARDDPVLLPEDRPSFVTEICQGASKMRLPGFGATHHDHVHVVEAIDPVVHPERLLVNLQRDGVGRAPERHLGEAGQIDGEPVGGIDVPRRLRGRLAAERQGHRQQPQGCDPALHESHFRPSFWNHRYPKGVRPDRRIEQINERHGPGRSGARSPTTECGWVRPASPPRVIGNVVPLDCPPIRSRASTTYLDHAGSISSSS